MTDFELEKKLKSAPEPALEGDYLEGFPKDVLAKIRSTPQQRRTGNLWLPRLIWGGSIAVACLIVGFAIGHRRGRSEAKQAESNDVLANAKVIREALAIFPHQVRAIVQDQQGMQLVLSGGPDVPVSVPLYVRICNGKQCASLVTFSGQEIRVAGQNLTVLSDGHGGIIVTGNNFVWSSRQPTYAENNMQIEAKSLGAVAM